MFKFAIPLFLILLSGGLFFSYIDPVYSEIKKLNAENEQYGDALNKAKELRQVRDQLLSVYNTFEKTDLDRVEKLLPDNVDNIKLIMEIDKIANKYGVIIRRVDISKNLGDSQGSLGPNTKDYNSMNLNFTLEASYKSFIMFLNDLSDDLRITDVENLSFQSTELDLYKYKLEMKTYWLK